MGLFNKLTDAIKDAAPVIGGVVGFGLGGAGGAALGSGIGGLVAGQDVEEAMKTAAIGGALGYGAGKVFPGSAGFLRAAPTQVAPQAAGAFTVDPGQAFIKQDVAAATDQGLFSNLTTGQKLGLGAAGLGSLALLGSTEEEEENKMSLRPEPTGRVIGTPVTTYRGEQLDLSNPEDVALYTQRKAEVRDPGFTYPGFLNGGEVEGPGTGTSDSVPARLSDGEFVLTAKAVRGAGGGDRDIGAARMYDMMAELEAMA